MTHEERWVPQPAKMGKGILAGLDRVVAVLAVAGFGSMAIIIAIQVAARYALNSPTVWSEELAISLFVWSTMLAIPLGLRRGEHLTLDLISKYLPASVVRWIALAIAVATAAVFVILGWLTLSLLGPADRQLLAGIADGLGIQARVSWVYIAVPVGAVLAVIFTAERAIAFFTGRLDELNADADKAVIDMLDTELGGDVAQPPAVHTVDASDSAETPKRFGRRGSYQARIEKEEGR